MGVRLVLEDATQLGDIQRDGGNIEIDDGLEAAVVISLFTWARAPDSEVLRADDTDRQGWWGDSFPLVEGDSTGSLLWLLVRRESTGGKLTLEAVNEAAQFARDALQWMVEDGVVEQEGIEVEAFRDGGVLCMSIAITRPGDSNSRWQRIWRIRADAI